MSPQNDYSKSFFIEVNQDEKVLIQKLINLWEKTSLQNSTFFRKVPFRNRIFKEKVYFEIMPFKKSTKSEKLVVVRGANRVKTLFHRRDVFFKIWFVNINWTRNLFFRKKLSPQNDSSKSFLTKSATTKNSRF